ncbi:hypothetical protein ILFOPFJJ_06401 [Ensifer psoraleae]|uniref:DUF2243 domain-containing protein n=1 Tax=Sinorhizobium psoraleae TaxID=520838 RepID=UPI0015687B00|nr:DUF2243 domain-containing protein [Sinorhizobium psoraleae]NRP75478.1 hypothetical protein [Sinorhizobium psoraleae]
MADPVARIMERITLSHGQRSRLVGYFALAIGGFFDGILLHQILQWHHLLSGIGDRGADLRFQVMADGFFHLAMYVLLLVGLGLLWRQRRDTDKPEFAATAMAWALMGFGAWHLLDAVLSHWLLGLHRIKTDSPKPLFWDLLWLAVFGIGPLLPGWRFLKRPPGPLSGPAVLVVVLSSVAIGAAAASLLPAARGTPQAVLFREDISESEIMRAIAAAGASVLSTEASGTMWVVRFESPLLAYQLYRSGAIMVGGTPAAGCLTYSVPAVAPRV